MSIFSTRADDFPNLFKLEDMRPNPSYSVNYKLSDCKHNNFLRTIKNQACKTMIEKSFLNLHLCPCYDALATYSNSGSVDIEFVKDRKGFLK